MKRFIVAVALLAFAPLADAEPKPREVCTAPHRIGQLMVSADGALVAAHTYRSKTPPGKAYVDDGSEAFVWEIATGKLRLSTGKTNLSALGFTADGKTLVMGGPVTIFKDNIRIEETHFQTWDIETGKAGEMKVLLTKLAGATLSVDRKTVVTVTGLGGGLEHTVETWDAATGKLVDSFDLDRMSIRAYQQVVDGPFLAVLNKPKFALELLSRDPKTGKTTTSNLTGLAYASISADGKWIVGHGSKDLGFEGIRLFDTLGRQKWSVKGVFDPSRLGVAGEFVVAPDLAGKVHLYDLAKGKPIQTLDVGARNINAWILSPDGKTLFVSTRVEEQTYKSAVKAFDLGGK